jgi:predicted MFS family arabinose efflux permease
MGVVRRWLIMLVLGFSGGVIYLLPYLKEVYYRPLADALDLSNTQVGLMMSAFGVTALISYFPGGWIADRFSARVLISLSLISTGLLGIYFATFPGFIEGVVIHAVWGVTITLLFWASMIRVTRGWAPPDQQGRAFGILETTRGVAELGASALFGAIFIWLGSTTAALGNVISQMSAMIVVLGVASWFIIEDTMPRVLDENHHKAGIRDVMAVLKMPVVWLIALVMLATNSAYNASYYIGAYSSDVFLATTAFATLIGIGRMVFKPVAAFVAGLVADKAGVAKTSSVFLATLLLSSLTFAAMPARANFLHVMLVNVAVVMIAIFALRGIYFALLEQGNVPRALTGTAGGVVSAVAFTSDAYMPTVTGVLLDSFPGVTGYRYLFLMTAITCAIGLAASVLIHRRHSHPNSGD